MDQRRGNLLGWAIGVAGGVSLVSPAASMPARIWTGADTILLRCSPAASLEAGMARRVCDAILATLRSHSPYPVRQWVAGSDAAKSPRSVLIEVSIAPSAQPATASLAVRIRKAVSIDDAEGEVVRPPRPLATGTSEALAASTRRALDPILPWRSAAGRPFRPRIRPAS